MSGVCTYCQKHNSNLKLCSGCFLAAYCSNDCAQRDWIGKHAIEEDEENEHAMDLILGSGKKGEWGIWLGGLKAFRDKQMVGHMDAVVTALGPDYNEADLIQRVSSYVKASGVEIKRIVIWDHKDENIAQYFEEVASFVQKHKEMNHHILIHCAAGRSRSASLLIYYMIRYGGFASVGEAIQFVEKIRPTINPNKGFLKQLKEAEKRLRKNKDRIN